MGAKRRKISRMHKKDILEEVVTVNMANFICKLDHDLFLNVLCSCQNGKIQTYVRRFTTTLGVNWYQRQDCDILSGAAVLLYPALRLQAE